MTHTQYDYLVVGAGPFGAVFAHEAARQGKRVHVIDKRPQVGGNLATHQEHGITVHDYGAHIFHTDNLPIWQYVRQFVPFMAYQNQVLANYHGELYNLPFNMNTFYQMWGTKTPAEAAAKIASQRERVAGKTPRNLEEQAIALIGEDIYQRLIKGYTEKQWGRAATELPAFIIKRLPVRFTYDNNYFNHRYQGLPVGGYTPLIEQLLADPLIDVTLEADFMADKATYLATYPRIIYTGMIDEYFDYQYGPLEYRSLRFEQQTHAVDNVQGVAVMNYTDRETPYTRVMEWKHFDGAGATDMSITTHEYPQAWAPGDEAYYPVNDQANQKLYQQYQALTPSIQDQVVFGGRLGGYRYYDMDQVIHSALNLVRQEFGLPATETFVDPQAVHEMV